MCSLNQTGWLDHPSEQGVLVKLEKFPHQNSKEGRDTPEVNFCKVNFSGNFVNVQKVRLEEYCPESYHIP